MSVNRRRMESSPCYVDLLIAGTREPQRTHALPGPRLTSTTWTCRIRGNRRVVHRLETARRLSDGMSRKIDVSRDKGCSILERTWRCEVVSAAAKAPSCIQLAMRDLGGLSRLDARGSGRSIESSNRRKLSASDRLSC